jgi:hypothetical protein
MPLTPKGEKIMRKMKKTYGDDETAERVFYASAESGRITGVHAEDKPAHKRKEKRE